MYELGVFVIHCPFFYVLYCILLTTGQGMPKSCVLCAHTALSSINEDKKAMNAKMGTTKSAILYIPRC